MKKPRSFITFKDGHEEDIFYYQINKTYETVMCATKSGIYLCRNSAFPSEIFSFMSIGNFARIELDNCCTGISIRDEFNISTINIDERIPYKFDIAKDGDIICGEILVDKNATEKEIKHAILDSLNVTYVKKE